MNWRWVLGIIAAVVIFACWVGRWVDTRCKDRCYPMTYEIVGRDGLCFCHKVLKSGETCLERP